MAEAAPRTHARTHARTHVHDNTVKNRLDRVDVEPGPIVTNAVGGLECEVAIYVQRHYDGPWRATTEEM